MDTQADRIFAGRTGHFVGFVTVRLKYWKLGGLRGNQKPATFFETQFLVGNVPDLYILLEFSLHTPTYMHTYTTYIGTHTGNST